MCSLSESLSFCLSLILSLSLSRSALSHSLVLFSPPRSLSLPVSHFLSPCLSLSVSVCVSLSSSISLSLSLSLTPTHSLRKRASGQHHRVFTDRDVCWVGRHRHSTACVCVLAHTNTTGGESACSDGLRI